MPEPGLGGGSSRTVSRIVFWCGFVLFVVARMAYAVVPSLSRAEPVEIDDAYRYLAQAQVMAECFDGSCPAIQSLAMQMQVEGGDEEVAFHRLRTDIHLFTYFHPLYSLVLTGLRALGLGAPQAYNLASAVLGFVVCVAIGLWIRTVWGPAAAGIALGLLAFYQLPGQGLHFVPGTLAWGWAALSWVVILRRDVKRYRYLPLLWIAALGTHPMGVFYVAAALLMIAWMNGWRMDRPAQRLLAVGVLLVLGRVILAGLVPVFALSGDAESYYATGTTWGQAFQLGGANLLDLVARWGATYWSLAAAALLVVVGLAATPASHARRVWAAGLSLAAILLASLGYYHPVHGSTATGRIWASVAFFLIGAVGNAITFWLGALWTWIARIRRGAGAAPAGLIVRGAGLLLLGALVLRSLATNLRYSSQAFAEGILKATTKDDLGLGGSDAFAPLLEMAPDQAALFVDEISLYAGLAHGALEREAVYLPIVAGTEGERRWVQANDRLAYVVGLSPVSQMPWLRQGGLALGPGTPLEVLSSTTPGPDWDAIRLENLGDAATLLLSRGEILRSGAEALNVPAGFSGWMPLPESLDGETRFSLMTASDAGQVRVLGLRLDGEAATSWPWDRGVRLSAIDPSRPSQPVVVSLSTSNLAQAAGFPVEVVSDDQSVLLARIRR
ncbi:MAG: hypothetical protein MUO23_07705 [Anaerolineales bacterium]|nr:hypothetical protein [Anaerolineales bacterium]